MKSPNNPSRPTATLWIPLILIALVAVGGLSYRYASPQTAAPAAAQGQAAVTSFKTRQVRTGSIILATSGSVKLVASQESSLAFTVSGTVAQLNAAIGDQVARGQILAQLDNLDELEADIKTAEQDLLSAQQGLAAFRAKAPANLATAQLQVIEAQEALQDMQDSAVQKDSVRCSQETRDQLLVSYNRAVAQLNALGDGGGHADYYLNTILPQKQKVDQALGAYQSCAGFTEYQIASSQANLSLAQANLQQAQDTLATLTKNNGLNPSQLAAIENKVAAAEQTVETAKDNLAGATLSAPFDGVILAVSGKVGDPIEITTRNKTVAFITIADLAHPLLSFSVDETDMSMVAVGEKAIITFDAFPNRAFHGAVQRIDPTISSSEDVSKVTGIIQMDLSQETDIPAFPKNLSGSAQIIQASVENALLIPVEALRENNDGTYAVYVVGADGQPTPKVVEVGLRDVASVEIKSGLDASDTVITSAVQ